MPVKSTIKARLTSADICLGHPRSSTHIKKSCVTQNRLSWLENLWTPLFLKQMSHLKRGEVFQNPSQQNKQKPLPGISNDENFQVWVRMNTL